MATISAADIHLQKCPHHDTENQSFYCANHEVPICGRCLHSNHKQCDCVDLFTVTVEDSRQSETIAMLSAFEKEIEGYEMTLRKDIQLNEQCKSTAMYAVDSFCSNMMKRLTALKKDAERECTNKHNQNSERLGELVRKCSEEKIMVSQRKQLVEVLVQKQHYRNLYIEMCRLNRNKNDMASRINSLLKNKQTVQFSFRPNDKLANAVSQINEIGKIQETMNESDEVTENIDKNDAIQEVLNKVGFREKTETLCDKRGRGSMTAGKKMLYTLFGNVIVMLEEYEARTDAIKLARSEIETPDQSWRTVEDVMDNTESQLVLFEAHVDSCPLTGSVITELRIKVIYWAAVRAEKQLLLTGTDTFIARLYEILAKRSSITKTSMRQTTQKLWHRRHDASGMDSSDREIPGEILPILKTRTPTNSLDVRIGAKRIQDVNPPLAPWLKEDIETELLQLASLR